MRRKEYKPIEFRQLCMVVKVILQQAPKIDDAEWKARARDRLEALGFDEPDPEMLSRAMTQVEQALKQTIGHRLTIPAPAPPSAPQPPPPESKQRTNRPVGWDIVTALMSRLSRVSPVLERTSPTRPPAREILGVTEPQALDEFWRQIRNGADKLTQLQAFAEIAILRPAGWDQDEIRRRFSQLRFGDEGCFVCNFDETERHHIIQIQHGGSNYARNFVPLCSRCHGEVHPWLPKKPRRSGGGWYQVGAIHIDDLRDVPGRKRKSEAS